MFRRVCAAALTVLLLAGPGTMVAADAAYTPRGGARFNDPSGGKPAQDRSMSHVKRSIKNTPKKGIIRIAVYSYDRKDVTDALIAACKKRNVSVQVVLNDNWTSGQTRRLRKLLGTNINPHWDDACNKRKKPDKPKKSDKKPYPVPSFVKICYQSCRLGAGNQHMKFFLFSETGKAKHVVMVGSTNLARWAAKVHWNDLFTQKGRKGMFQDYSTIFRQLAEDKRRKKTYWKVTHGDLVTEFGPKQGATGKKDPVAKRLDKVSCKAKKGSGIKGRTAIRIKMYAWTKSRGLFLAKKVAGLRRKGCHVRVLVSGASKDVKNALRRGGVSMRSADLNLDGNKDTGFGTTAWERFTHQKWMALNGTWDGKGQRVVWTGSENWSNRSFINDEVTIKIPRKAAFNSYMRHFNYVWKRHSRAI